VSPVGAECPVGSCAPPAPLPFLIRAVALPVRANGRLVGSMALHWPMDQAPVERVLSLHLASLESTIRDVQQALA